MHPVLTVPTTAAHNLRRSVLLAACLGGLGLAVLALVGRPALGLFILLGLSLAALNARAVQRSVVQFAASEAAHRRRRFTINVLGRLGLLTLVAVACALLVRPEGLGVVAGLAAFQLIMVGGASLPLLKELRS